MTTNGLRRAYLDFFKNHAHVEIPSASLLPENDPTTLFTGSGMQPILPYLLGELHPSGKRLVDSQKCFRSQDIEEVGDNCHTTFFEMLGNWSLGDYFKTEQVQWFFLFLTDVVKLNPERLYISCFCGQEDIGIPKDKETASLWQTAFKEKGIDAKIIDFVQRDGIQGGHIFYYDASKNWWSRAGKPENMPVGEPGGPDTEVFWDSAPDREEKHLYDKDNIIFGSFCHPNCECGRFFEIGNNVFMQYIKKDKGFVPLEQKNVDFGGGLERIAAAMIDSPDVFKIDLFDTQREVLERMSGKIYGTDKEETRAFRIILDHMRAVTFLIADGAFPSNKDQGYFTRRFIRRAIRYAGILGISDSFCSTVADAVIETYKEVYPNLKEKKDVIMKELEKEETKFKHTINKGTKKFQELVNSMANTKMLSGIDAFDLYQSYGFPIELTVELAKEHGIGVDVETFTIEKEKHQMLSRKGAQKKFYSGLANHSKQCTKYHTATHLFHAACIRILGPDATQKGSNITEERMRFDFVHFGKVTQEQIKELENLVNAAIVRDYLVSFEIMTTDEAKATGAIGLFEKSYNERVKVYTIGDPNESAVADPLSSTFSREFCGGPHVEHTGELGHFKIIKEESVSAGVRRIKAVLE